jgi:hypothetical protein
VNLNLDHDTTTNRLIAYQPQKYTMGGGLRYPIPEEPETEKKDDYLRGIVDMGR